MKETAPTRGLTPPTLGQFREFVKKVISVPKAEIDKREMEYKHKRKKKTTRQKDGAPEGASAT